MFSLRFVFQIDYSRKRKSLHCQLQVMKALSDRCLTPAESKKPSVGHWRWSLDNIRWPLRAAETVGLHGTALLLLSCLDTLFFLPLLLHLLLNFSVSAEWSFCELAACIWSWGNLLVVIRKWCAQSFVIVLSDRAIWSLERPNWRNILTWDRREAYKVFIIQIRQTKIEWRNNLWWLLV